MVWGALLNLGATALGVGGSLAAGDKAAEGADAAAQAQLSMYRQNRNDLAPYREVGGHALNAYARAMGLPQSTSGPTSNSAASQLTMLEGVRTKDKSGNRNVYVDNYSGDLYRINSYGEYESFGTLNDTTGNKYGAIGGIETNKNKAVKWSAHSGTLSSRGKEIGSFRLQERPSQSQEFIGGSETNPEDDPYGGFMESPGYQFRFDEGQRGVNRNAAARGRYMSGAREKASIRYGQNYASNEFGNYMNRLAGAANIGQTATNTGVSAGQNSAAYAGNAMINSGNARASGYMGAVNTGINAVNNWQAGQAYRNPYHDNGGNSTWGPYAGGYRRG